MSFVLKEVEQILKLRFPDQCKYETNNISQTIPEAGHLILSKSILNNYQDY